MDNLNPQATQWLLQTLGEPFKARKHEHAHQDEVYKIETQSGGSQGWYLKIAPTLKSEHDNLKNLESSGIVLHVPKVIDYHRTGQSDYLLITQLPGKSLIELIGEWPDLDIACKFADAVKLMHGVDATKIYPEASSKDVLLHGDMSLPNIIIDEAGHIGFIDFGQIAFGSPDQDLADAIWSLQRNIGPDYGELFLKHYGPVAMSPTIQKALQFRYQPSVSKSE